MSVRPTLRVVIVSMAALLLLPGAARPAQDRPGIEPRRAEAPTRILDRAAAQRLQRNKGITLQWIDWNRRGRASITVDRRGGWRLRGEQRQTDGTGRLHLDGKVTEIGRDYFLFDGTVRITDAPDKARHCEATKLWRFAITQNRRYWRLREFEWCDDLTDYVDIYF